MLGAGARTGAAGDLPDVYGSTASVGWHRGGIENWFIGGGAVRWRVMRITRHCTATPPWNCQGAVAVRCHWQGVPLMTRRGRSCHIFAWSKI
jgi:hypothetical protein